MIVYNAEPLDYSKTAIKLWRDKGYIYQPGSWKEINSTLSFPKVSILIVRLEKKVDKKIFKKFPDLVYLLSATTGKDHLDLKAIKDSNIKLLTLKDHTNFLHSIPSTAEHTWALLLALIRNIVKAHESVNKGYWNRNKFRGNQLYNKSIGIVGLGRIGSKVAQFSHAFGMNIQYYDPSENNDRYKKCYNLEELMSSSDIISVHVHLNSKTTGLISSSLLKKVKKGALLINTSRGKVLDEKAVVNALDEKKLGGVAVDVLDTEFSDIRNSLIWKARNDYSIIITPHIGGATFDAMQSCEEYIQKLVPNKKIMSC